MALKQKEAIVYAVQSSKSSLLRCSSAAVPGPAHIWRVCVRHAAFLLGEMLRAAQLVSYINSLNSSNRVSCHALSFLVDN
jgi:hypothetical protein